MAHCLVGLGANIGDRRATLARAAAQLAAHPRFVIEQQSRLHETVAVGGPAGQGTYLNGVVLLETSMAPEEVFAALVEIEASLGRVRNERWGPRTIDLDLLLYDQVVIVSPLLTLPHPRMAFRKFVIEPAAEIAADLRHPTIGWTMRALRDHLRDARAYVAIGGARGLERSQLAANLVARLGGRLIANPSPPPLRSQDVDSPSRALQAEIELLTLRRQLLDPAQWPAGNALAISDFWLEQSRVRLVALSQARGAHTFPSLSLPAADKEFLADVKARYDDEVIATECQTAVRPKLLVLLDPPVPTGEELPTGDDNLSVPLREAAGQPGVGPLLHLTGSDPAANLAEAAAAIAAMN